MITQADENSLSAAATVHSIAWIESHKSFCSKEFTSIHTPEHQLEYLRQKMQKGSKIFLCIEDIPIGLVSITGSLIEDLYVLPEKQNKGYGTQLLMFAIGQCTDTPHLWILENNTNAERLYERIGFQKTGRRNMITNKLDEIELAYKLK